MACCPCVTSVYFFLRVLSAIRHPNINFPRAPVTILNTVNFPACFPLLPWFCCPYIPLPATVAISVPVVPQSCQPAKGFIVCRLQRYQTIVVFSIHCRLRNSNMSGQFALRKRPSHAVDVRRVDLRRIRQRRYYAANRTKLPSFFLR